jgi:hypothetical protein
MSTALTENNMVSTTADPGNIGAMSVRLDTNEGNNESDTNETNTNRTQCTGLHPIYELPDAKVMYGLLYACAKF